MTVSYRANIRFKLRLKSDTTVGDLEYRFVDLSEEITNPSYDPQEFLPDGVTPNPSYDPNTEIPNPIFSDSRFIGFRQLMVEQMAIPGTAELLEATAVINATNN